MPATPEPSQSVCVSLLVPARDEEANLRRTLPGLLAQGATEVLVLDDHSQDATAECAAELGARVLPGLPLPADWYGKPWACQQLGQAARGDLLVFTDADVTWQPGALAALVREQQRTGADLLSVFPRQDNLTLGERLLTPIVDDVILSLFPAPLLALPFPAASAANGQVMLLTRQFYRQLGGHAAVKTELLEDIALARRAKERRGRVALALGRGLIGVRMYHSYPESVQGFSKNALPMHGGLRSIFMLSWAAHFLVYTWPLLRRQPAPVLLALLESLLVRWITGRQQVADLAEAALTPALPLLSLPVFWQAWRSQVEWKGRKYTQKRK